MQKEGLPITWKQIAKPEATSVSKAE